MSQFSARPASPGTWAAGGADHPQPHRRRHRRHRQQVGEQGRGREGLRSGRRSAAPSPGWRRSSPRRPRPGRRAKPPPPIRAAIASRSGAASRKIPSTAAKLSCQPMSAAMPGSIASVTPSASSKRVEARGAPPRQRCEHAGGAHHPGPLDRGTGAGQRHVDGDQRQHPDQPLAQGDAERAQQRHRQQRQQGHVLTADGEQVAQPGAAEVLLRPRVDLPRPRRARSRGPARPRARGMPRPSPSSARARGSRRCAAAPPRPGRRCRPGPAAAGAASARCLRAAAGPAATPSSPARSRDTWSSWSTEARPPCSSRNSTMSCGGHRADALDRVELLDGGGAEADRPLLRPAGAGRGASRPDHVRAPPPAARRRAGRPG